jgi:putative peptidoglycan lipid II flippase
VKEKAPRFAWMLAGAGAAAAAVRGAGLLKELAVAARFGTGDGLEAFLLALALPMLLAGALRSAILSSLVPRLAAARERGGEEEVRRLLASSLARHVLLAAGTAALLALLARPAVLVVASGFPAEKQALTEHLLLLLSVVVLFDGIAAIFSAALQARGKIAIATLGMLGSPVVTLAALLATAGSAPEILVLGAILGSLAEVVWGVAHLAAKGVSPFVFRHPLASHASEAARGFAKLLGGAIVVSVNPIVDQAMAAHLGPGAVAGLGYGGRIAGGILGVLAIAFGTAALTRYSMYAAASDVGGLAKAFRRDASFVLVLGTGIAVALAAASLPLTRLLFERGAFSTQDTAEVARIQVFYAVQIPGYLVGILGARAMNALARDWEILWISGFGAVLNVALNLILSRWLGAAGIALSTGVVYTVSAVAMVVVLRGAFRKGG